MEAEVALADLGLTISGLIKAAEGDPRLGPTMGRLTSEEAKVRRALQYYGDEAHPVPVVEGGSVYDVRGVLFVGPEEPRRLIDGEPAEGREPELVAHEPAPQTVRLPPPPSSGALVERVVDQIERPPARAKPGVKPTEVDTLTKRKVAKLVIDEGASIAEVRRQTGLSKTVATRLVRDVQDALGMLRAGRY